MIFPKWISQGDIIGVTAVSDGVSDELDKIRFNNGREKLQKSGYPVVMTQNVFTADEKGRSSDGVTRATQFSHLLEDNNVGCIISAKGGNYLNEMLEFFDFDSFVKRPVWFQGYSDNTWLIHTLTTVYDIATIYGNNFGDFGMDNWHPSIWDNIDLLEGKKDTFGSYEKYQDGFADRHTGLESYELKEIVKWKIMNSDSAHFSGRMIGGCLDVLLFIQGTKYDNTISFIEKYKSDGIVWYLESFATDSENLMMFLWKLKEIGWFKHCNGVIFGRPMFYNTFSDTSYEEAVRYVFGKLEIPVVFDCDFGHKPPRMPIVNGAVADVSVECGRGTIKYGFK